MKPYTVVVSWMMSANVVVEAESVEDAIIDAENDPNLPKDGVYVGDSFIVDEDATRWNNRDQ